MSQLPPLPQMLDPPTAMSSKPDASTASQNAQWDTMKTAGVDKHGRSKGDGFPMRGPSGVTPMHGTTVHSNGVDPSTNIDSILAAAGSLMHGAAHPQRLQQLQQQQKQLAVHPPVLKTVATTATPPFAYDASGASTGVFQHLMFPTGSLLTSGGGPATPTDSPFASTAVRLATETTASIARGGQEGATSGFPMRGPTVTPTPRSTGRRRTQRQGRGRAVSKSSRAVGRGARKDKKAASIDSRGAWSERNLGDGLFGGGAGLLGGGANAGHMMMPRYAPASGAASGTLGHMPGALGHAMDDGNLAIFYQMQMQMLHHPQPGMIVGSNGAAVHPQSIARSNASASPKDPEIDPKLMQKREKNKEAAQKCRAKKRDLITSLEAQCAAVQDDNSKLRREIDDMQERLSSATDTSADGNT